MSAGPKNKRTGRRAIRCTGDPIIALWVAWAHRVPVSASRSRTKELPMPTPMLGGDWCQRPCVECTNLVGRSTQPNLAVSSAQVCIGVGEGVCTRLLDCRHRVCRTCDYGRQNCDDREKGELRRCGGHRFHFLLHSNRRPFRGSCACDVSMVVRAYG